LPFGDAQYRLSRRDDWNPKDLVNVGDGEIIVERHGRPYKAMTWKAAKEWVAESTKLNAEEQDAMEREIKRYVREHHCSRREAEEKVDYEPSPYFLY